MDEERTLKRMTAFGTIEGVLDENEEHIYLKGGVEITIFQKNSKKFFSNNYFCRANREKLCKIDMTRFENVHDAHYFARCNSSMISNLV